MRLIIARAGIAAVIVLGGIATPAHAASGDTFSCPGGGTATLSTAHALLSVPQGASATFTVTINRDPACTGAISFYPVSETSGPLPAGMTATWATESTTSSSIALTVRTSRTWPNTTPVGSYGFQVIPMGAWYQAYLMLQLDVTRTAAPLITAFTQKLVRGSTIGSSSTPVTIRWAATDPDGVASYQLQRQANGGTWSTVSLSSAKATSKTQSLTFGTIYRYRVRATDSKGYGSTWAYLRAVKPRVIQQGSSAITSSWTWRTVLTSAASGGSLKYNPYSGSDFTYTFTAGAVGFVSVTGPTRSDRLEVVVDNKNVLSNASLQTPTVHYRRIVYAGNWTTEVSHTLWVLNQGTVGSSRLDVDAMVLLDLQ